MAGVTVPSLQWAEWPMQDGVGLKKNNGFFTPRSNSWLWAGCANFNVLFLDHWKLLRIPFPQSFTEQPVNSFCFVQRLWEESALSWGLPLPPNVQCFFILLCGLQVIQPFIQQMLTRTHHMPGARTQDKGDSLASTGGGNAETQEDSRLHQCHFGGAKVAHIGTYCSQNPG